MNVPEVYIGFRKRWLLGDRVPERRESKRRLAGMQESIAEVVVQFGDVGAKLNRLLKNCDRFSELLSRQQDVAKIVVNLNEPWGTYQNLPIEFFRSGPVSRLVKLKGKCELIFYVHERYLCFVVRFETSDQRWNVLAYFVRREVKF